MPRRLALRVSQSVLLPCLCLALTAPNLGRGQESPKKPVSVLDHHVKTIDGEEIALTKFQGEVLLIVNTASQCGYTSQYQGLEALHVKYKARGFRVLAFPSNDFGRQEPGSEAEIKAFCQAQYRVTFPLFAKTVVKGDGIHPLYAYLSAKDTNPRFAGDVSWNFAKFLINRKGEIVARFEPNEMPESETLVREIEASLARAK